MIRASRYSARPRRLWALAWAALFALIVNPLSAANHSMSSMAVAAAHEHVVSAADSTKHCHTAQHLQTKACCGHGGGCCGLHDANCTCPMVGSDALVSIQPAIRALAIDGEFHIASPVFLPVIHSGPPLRPPAA